MKSAFWSQESEFIKELQNELLTVQNTKLILKYIFKENNSPPLISYELSIALQLGVGPHSLLYLPVYIPGNAQQYMGCKLNLEGFVKIENKMLGW